MCSEGLKPGKRRSGNGRNVPILIFICYFLIQFLLGETDSLVL